MAHNLGLLLVLVVALGVGVQWLCWRFRVPAIVLLSIAGLIVGPVLGWLEPERDFSPLFHPIIGLSVAVILFEGGLNLHFHELKEAAKGVRRLVFVGVPLGWGLGTAAAYYVGGLGFPVSMVFGAIMVVTGPTVILPLLRHASLNRRSAAFLKWEAIINDPIGALLATLVFEYFILASGSSGNQSVGRVILDLAGSLGSGVAVGVTAAFTLGLAFRRSLIPEFLKAPVTLAVVLVAYSLSNLVQENAGLFAVTSMGLVMGNMNLPSMDEMRRFKEYVSILLVSILFVILTANLQFSTLGQLNWRSLGLIATMILVVRPLVVYFSTLGTRMYRRDRLLLAAVAPRGVIAAAVGGVFGPVMARYGYADADLLLPLVFAMVFATVAVYGFSIGCTGRRLRLATSPHGVLIVGASPWTIELARTLGNELKVNVLLADSAWHRLRDARMAGINVHYGEILSDQVQQSLELNEIACVLAATSNDAYNALVCTRLSGELGHNQVFQLPIYADDEENKSLDRNARGAIAIAADARYEELWRRHLQGWKFYKTRMTEAYSYEDFLRDGPRDMIVIAVIGEHRAVRFKPADESVKPKTHETLLYYAPGRPVEAAIDKKNAEAGKSSRTPAGAWQGEPEISADTDS